MSCEPKSKITEQNCTVKNGSENKKTIVSNYDFIKSCSVKELAAFLADYESRVIEQIIGEDTVPMEALAAEVKHLEE